MKNNETFTYELLILDDSGVKDITTPKSLLMGLSYSEKLWKSADIKDNKIEDANLNVSLEVQKIESNSGENAFFLSLSLNDAEKGFNFFSSLVNHIKDKLNFNTVRVITDGVTDKVAAEVYPAIRQVEAAAKSYIQKYSIKEHGLNWWDKKASSELKNAIQKRKANIPDYLSAVESEFAFTNFNDLNPFIKEAFTGDVVKNWDALQEIRNKIADNSFLTLEDLDSAQKTSEALLSEIEKADNKLGNLKAAKSSASSNGRSNGTGFQVKEEQQKESVQAQDSARESKPEPVAEKREEPKAQEAPKPEVKTELKEQEPEKKAGTQKTETAVADATEKKEEPKKEKVVEVDEEFDAFKIINEDTLIKELKAHEETTSDYIDLKVFVNDVLGKKGYMGSPTFSLAKTMSANGKIKIYDAKDERGLTVAAVKTI